MGSRKRIVFAFVASLVFAGVVAAAAGGLYAYSDAELAGPEQPIQFSHAVHAGAPADGGMGIQCLYCHTAADKSQHATIPAVSTCMGCHNFVSNRNPDPKKSEDENALLIEASKAEIQKLRDFYNRGESIPWLRIHNLPEHVQFKHMRHVQAGVDCQTCHGPIETMNRVYMTEDTKLRPSSAYLPAAKLEMGWCMDCHLERGASDDCGACHY